MFLLNYAENNNCGQSVYGQGRKYDFLPLAGYELISSRCTRRMNKL